MSILTLYLINVVFNIHSLTVPMVMIGLFAGLLLASITAMYVAEGTEAEKRFMLHVSKWYAIVYIIVLLLNLVTIDREDAAWIAGGYVVTNAEGVSELPENVVKAANPFLKSISGDEANEAAD